MTRFARAKGSKSSNERKEEDATPWKQLRTEIPPSKKHFNVEDMDDVFMQQSFDDENEQNEKKSEVSSDEEEAKEPNILGTIIIFGVVQLLSLLHFL